MQQFFVSLFFAIGLLSGLGDAIDTVPNLNITQYLGKWYQVSA